MCATAANLIERVLPETALRQWVLTFPFPWRRRLAHDGALLSALSRIFVESVHAFYVERAAAGGARGAKTGAVTVVQRTSKNQADYRTAHFQVFGGDDHPADRPAVRATSGRPPDARSRRAVGRDP